MHEEMLVVFAALRIASKKLAVLEGWDCAMSAAGFRW
jgi:hypothetical protein